MNTRTWHPFPFHPFGAQATLRVASTCLVLAVLAVVGAIAGTIAGTGPAAAHNSQTRPLQDQLERLQRELVVLQRQVYQNSGGAGGTAGSGNVAPTQAARLELRMSQFEDTMRRLTGNAEELSYRLDQVSRRLDDFMASVNQRLDQLESTGRSWSQVGGEAEGGAAGSPTGNSETQQAGAASAQAAASTGGSLSGNAAAGTAVAGTATAGGTAPGPRTIGTVSAADLETFRTRALALQQGGQQVPAQQQGGATQTALRTPSLPGNTPKEQYAHAFGLLSQANYPAAEQALLAFLQQHPSDPLAGNAKYWLGETYYVRELYREAAVAFAEGFQQYPTSAKAPDNLLKLGKSLAALGQTADACGTYLELTNRFPSAPATILQQAKSERQRLACS